MFEVLYEVWYNVWMSRESCVECVSEEWMDLDEGVCRLC